VPWKLAALALWLRDRGVDLSRVRFTRTAAAGCGLVAARDAAPNARFLSLPLEHVTAQGSAAAAWAPVALTSELPLATRGPLGAVGRALAAVDGVARLRDACAAPDLRFDGVQAALLAVALLHEVAGGAAAQWAPYIALLPRTLDAPALWSSDQLSRLAGSPISTAASARAAAVRAAHAALLPALSAADPTAFPPAVCTADAFAWAHATVLARAFDVPSLGLMALAPGLDLCNHGVGAGTVELEGGSAASATCAARAGTPPPALLLRAGAAGAAEGEPLLHAYAGAAAGESLLEYGFVDAAAHAHAHAHAALPLPSLVPLDLTPLLAAGAGPRDAGAALAALDAAGLCAPLRRFELSSVGVAGCDAAAGELMLPRRLLPTARALAATPAELEALASGRDALSRPLSAAAETRALDALLQLLHAAQGAYEGELQPPPPPPPLLLLRSAAARETADERRGRLAAAVVHGERCVLVAVTAALAQRRARAAAGAPELA
jgi:hypothetical protein